MALISSMVMGLIEAPGAPARQAGDLGFLGCLVGCRAPAGDAFEGAVVVEGHGFTSLALVQSLSAWFNAATRMK